MDRTRTRVDTDSLERDYGVQAVSSPSVAHFGASNNPVNRRHHSDRRTHSGVMPEYPSTNVHEYTMPRRLERPTPAIPCPNYRELDRLFLTERLQKSAYSGLKTWETLPFAELLYDGFPGASDDGDQWSSWLQFVKTTVQVDESTWFEFFKKPRWFDYRVDPRVELKEPSPPWKQLPDDGVHWSVDTEPLWDVLRIAIEVANRVLKKLIEENNPWFVPTSLLIRALFYNIDTILQAYWLTSPKLLRLGPRQFSGHVFRRSNRTSPVVGLRTWLD